MLDLTKLADQLPQISQHLKKEAISSSKRLERAVNLLGEMATQQDDFVAMHREWGDRLNFAAAVPIEPLDAKPMIIPAPEQHTVVATDGSQISPNHHEIAYCYLINTGRIVIHYGQNRHPLLDSVPEVFYRYEDLQISQQWGIKTEEWLGYQRAVSEAVVLADLAVATQGTINPHIPMLALVDGSLIHWAWESIPTAARDRLLKPVLAAWDQLADRKIPLISYISASRSSESLNFLRMGACTFTNHNCPVNCPDPATPPCQIFEPLRDSSLWGSLLTPGQRGPLWRSSAQILQHYQRHTVYFCYVHVGTEIARVEMPQWVAEDAQILNQALSLALTQVQKGRGYPVALAEAHNQAVIRGGDRTRFFSLLEQQLIKAGLKNIGISAKESRKRGSIT